MFDPQVWAAVPFHFWTAVMFFFGTMVGSLLNVCIHRMPRGESIISPPSHCPHCNYSIPWYLNMPLATWLLLRGKCANCKAPIAVRYFLVELLTGVAFLSCWLVYGHTSPALALVYCLLLAGFIVATFIDFEHLIIPDEITLGGVVAGFLCTIVVPSMHAGMFGDPGLTRAIAIKRCIIGTLVGGGLIYAILRAGKFFLGRQTVELAPDSRIIFTETALKLPEEELPFEEIFYRKSDTIALEAKTLELSDRCYFRVPVRLRPDRLEIGDEVFDPETVPHMEIVTDEIVLPREAMGLGDVKFMAGIGAFLGWEAVIFTLMASSVLGSIYGVTMIAVKRQSWSGRLYYGPFIALASTIWIFGGKQFAAWWFRR